MREFNSIVCFHSAAVNNIVLSQSGNQLLVHMMMTGKFWEWHFRQRERERERERERDRDRDRERQRQRQREREKEIYIFLIIFYESRFLKLQCLRWSTQRFLFIDSLV